MPLEPVLEPLVLVARMLAETMRSTTCGQGGDQIGVDLSECSRLTCMTPPPSIRMSVRMILALLVLPPDPTMKLPLELVTSVTAAPDAIVSEVVAANWGE